MPIQLPPDSPASTARRRELYRHWESEASLVRRIPDLSTLVLEGRILLVWVHEEGEYRCPEFQFDSQEKLIPQVRPLLTLLRGSNGVTSEEDQSGWLEMEWLYCPHALLEGGSPAECLPTDPEAVLAAAEIEFSAGIDGRW